MQKLLTVTFFFACCLHAATAQEDLLALTDSTSHTPKHQTISSAFKEGKLTSLQTTETVNAGTLEFSIAHRFGSMGAENGGHTLYGFDVASDIRLGLSIGITDKITLGIGRSKEKELIDGMVKYRFLTQTTDNHIPVSVAFYGTAAYSPQAGHVYFAGASPTADFEQKEAYRMSYLSQLLISRKFGTRISLLLAPTYLHRNYVLAKVNTDNLAEESNDLFAVAVGGRILLTKRFAIIADYYYALSDYRKKNPADPYYQALSVGVELETGGHVFHINLSNSPAIHENNFLPNSPDKWLKGGFKLGFSITRPFTLWHSK